MPVVEATSNILPFSAQRVACSRTCENRRRAPVGALATVARIVVLDMPYNILIWEQIRDRVKWKTNKLPADIEREIESDRSLQEFRGSDSVPWQLREVMQQRANSWIQRLYDFCCDAYRTLCKEPSIEFDMAVWAYCIEPFIMKEEINENGYRASPLLELLLCAVGSPPEKRRLLRVSQKDCCMAVRSKVWETWQEKLLHLPSKWNDAAAAMARYNAIEQQARRVAAGLTPVERKPLHSMVPVAQPEETAKATTPGFEPSQAAGSPVAAHQPQAPTGSGTAHISEIVDEEEHPVPVQSSEGKWEDIEISFISDERIQIVRGKKRETLNYTEFGFEDGRSGNPNQAWVVLRRLAERNGCIANQMEAGMDWPRLEKRIQEIRVVLRKHFGIEPDPIPFFEKSRVQDKNGYNTRFKISCAPSYRS